MICSPVLAKARQKAKESHQTHAVVEMDHNEERRQYAVPLTYCDSQEFECFEGVVLLIVHPDGATE